MSNTPRPRADHALVRHVLAKSPTTYVHLAFPEESSEGLLFWCRVCGERLVPRDRAVWWCATCQYELSGELLATVLQQYRARLDAVAPPPPKKGPLAWIFARLFVRR